jgi:uncharacterized protein YbbC (DUF1343 family)
MKFLKPAFIAGLIIILQVAYSQTKIEIEPAANRTTEYFSLLKDKRIALVGNHTSMINQTHLLDSLLAANIKVVRLFCPEHGFRGNASAGQRIVNETDPKTGLKIISLYGKRYKPKPSDLSGVDVVLFDIQDVGVRFYTYLSTLHYIMEACAENGIPLIVLDRPNPNGFYIDGPVLDLKYKSFVGLHPVPIVYGMTIGEYAQMINGEKWLKNGVTCNLTVIPCDNYTHSARYLLPEKPSPNLPNMQAVYLYPSLALFEGTCINVGRGTDFPFQVFGHPKLENARFNYTPVKNEGAAEPLHQDTLCKGIDLRSFVFNSNDLFTLQWLIYAYNNSPDKTFFFNRFFRNLSGNKVLKEQIEQGLTEEKIRETWKNDIESFKKIRSKYLIYPE